MLELGPFYLPKVCIQEYTCIDSPSSPRLSCTIPLQVLEALMNRQDLSRDQTRETVTASMAIAVTGIVAISALRASIAVQGLALTDC